MAAFSVKRLSLIIFIHVLRETTAPPRNDAEMETQHPNTNNSTMENSTDLSNITKKNLSGPDITLMKNSTDSSGLTRENFSVPNNISSANSTDPNDLLMENSTDLNATAMPNSTDPNNMAIDNFIDLNTITLSNATVPKNISMENSPDANDITTEYSTDPNGITTEYSTDPNGITLEYSTDPNDITTEYFTDPNDITTEYSSDPNGITTEYSTDPNDITTGNSSDPHEITMSNYANPNGTNIDSSIDSNDVVKANSIATIAFTCVRYGFTSSNLTTDVELLVRIIKGFSKCLIHEWYKLYFSELHNSTQRWNRSHNNNIDNLEHAKITVSIWLYGSPILIAVGTIGNILSFAVMLRKKIRQSTTSLYLSVLAIADTAVLYTGFLNVFIVKISGYHIFHSSQFACKFGHFIVFGLQQFDSWVLVNVALERVCAVFVPHKVKEIFTKKFATVSLIIQALVITGVNSHYFYTLDLVYHGMDGKLHSACTPLPTHKSFMKNIWPWIDLCLLSLIPFTIIISSNVAIGCRLLCSRYKRQRLNANSQVKMTSMTAILLTVSIVFLVTTAPFHSWLIQEWDLHQQATLELVSAILNMIYYINYSVNFFLYCVSGPHFRKELKVMFSWKKRIHAFETRNTPHIGPTTTTTL